MFSSREDIIAMTPQWKGERLPDGRPKVPDKYLDTMYRMTLEELWKPIFLQGYKNQFISMKSVHPEFKENGDINRKLVGRAVTAVYAPTRPDYYEMMTKRAAEIGLYGTPNQWVIDSLTERDVIVADMYDKIYKGTFLGGNLATAVRTKTKNGGAVIWGGIRDLEQVKKVPDIQVYYRGINPAPIRDFVLTGLNVPARIGNGNEAAICLPGDVVYGCSGGVLFIPPSLVADVVEGAAKTQIKDIFGFHMISANKYTTAQIDRNIWTEEMLDQLIEFIRNDPRGERYKDLDWSKEYEQARNVDPNDLQSAL